MCVNQPIQFAADRCCGLSRMIAGSFLLASHTTSVAPDLGCRAACVSFAPATVFQPHGTGCRPAAKGADAALASVGGAVAENAHLPGFSRRKTSGGGSSGSSSSGATTGGD